MKVSIELSQEYTPPHAVIYTDGVTEEIQRAVDLLNASDSPLIGRQGDRLVVIRPEEIYMIRVENGTTVIYTEKEAYESGRRLYELLGRLGNRFMQISRQVIINLAYVRSVEAGFGGTLVLKLKNGMKDYVSRTYLSSFKSYLGL